MRFFQNETQTFLFLVSSVLTNWEYWLDVAAILHIQLICPWCINALITDHMWRSLAKWPEVKWLHVSVDPMQKQSDWLLDHCIMMDLRRHKGRKSSLKLWLKTLASDEFITQRRKPVWLHTLCHCPAGVTDPPPCHFHIFMPPGVPRAEIWTLCLPRHLSIDLCLKKQITKTLLDMVWVGFNELNKFYWHFILVALFSWLYQFIMDKCKM